MRSKIMYGKLRLVGNEKAYTWTLHHHEKGPGLKDVKGEMVRAPCIDKNGMKKGAWSEDEDNKLCDYIQRFGHWNWRELPKYAGLARCGKSCRLRWMNYLRPSVKRGNFTKEEEDIIIKLHLDMGNKWSAIAALLPGRSDNEIKNHWHTHLKKRSIKENNNVVHEEHKSRIERIINFSVLPPSFESTSSENRISNESTSRSCVQHQLLIDLNQEYAESWEEDSKLKEELIEC